MEPKRCIALLLAILVLATGCTKNPFSLRDPEDPLVEEGTYVTPVDPVIALENLRFAMIEEILGHYVQIFSDSLTFAFDYLLVDQPGGTRTWNASEDSRIAASLFDGVDSVQLTWAPTEGRPDQFDDSVAVLYRTYELTVTPADTTGRGTEFEGEMIVTLERNTLDLWWIVRWEDSHLSGALPSWADLKSQYR